MCHHVQIHWRNVIHGQDSICAFQWTIHYYRGYRIVYLPSRLTNRMPCRRKARSTFHSVSINWRRRFNKTSSVRWNSWWTHRPSDFHQMLTTKIRTGGGTDFRILCDLRCERTEKDLRKFLLWHEFGGDKTNVDVKSAHKAVRSYSKWSIRATICFRSFVWR